MTAGVGLFGTFTGFVASLFMSPQQAAIKEEEDKIEAEEARIEDKLRKIEMLLAESETLEREPRIKPADYRMKVMI